MAEDKKKEEAKAKRATPLKRDDQNTKRRLRNRAVKSQVRTVTRQFEESLEKKDGEASKELLQAVYSSVDKAVQKGVFKLNKASRTKARLAARLAAN
jgi:small subunit ribosomal protein S20